MTEKIKKEVKKNVLFTIQSELEAVAKGSKGHNYKYADLKSVWEVVQPILERNEVFLTSESTVLTHAESGRNSVFITSKLISATTDEVLLESAIPLSWAKSLTPQDIGAAMTYFRRYNILLLLNVIVEDDDAAKAQASMLKAAVKDKGIIKKEDTVTDWEF